MSSVITPGREAEAWRDAARKRVAGALSLPALRSLAHDMPYRGQSKRHEIVAWLFEFYPERFDTED